MSTPITRPKKFAPSKRCLSDYMTVESGFYSYVVLGGVFGGIISLYRQGAFEQTGRGSRPSHFRHGSDPISDDDSDNRQFVEIKGSSAGANGEGSTCSSRVPVTLAAIRQNSTLAQAALGDIDSLQRNVTTHYFGDARY
ncbi:protein of unknown function [Taphrina deformans PYCC 5710]|uniref:Uncharacterized protein n=1 Tax=Taphrina deformans (strain PYCC 5710 / ATCC 11124 / CBS 356.35 / IMI 108563 / JCM 9778 / NBRC 8474) TaxID=1097556 RepID=R4X799_TAPDE|nr:protein of unknown function [Taphrina deformans PYCC 5710]|eukprot:CCG81176.1 protein of unknown function [Taphrina deformans PYCC 5710]